MHNNHDNYNDITIEIVIKRTIEYVIGFMIMRRREKEGGAEEKRRKITIKKQR